MKPAVAAVIKVNSRAAAAIFKIFHLLTKGYVGTNIAFMNLKL